MAILEKTLTITLTHPMFIDGEPHETGDVVEVNEKDAKYLIRGKRAVEGRQVKNKTAASN